MPAPVSAVSQAVVEVLGKVVTNDSHRAPGQQASAIDNPTPSTASSTD